MSSNMKLTRRGFLSGAASIGLGSTLGTNALLSSCVDKDKDKQILLHPINELYIP
ncbi:twin-arginine translocation signal domain-containing protein, partial [Parabacteroides distasonis]|nr:twin-arginine translocation signal domain-containing protein [Parabacteroides distasonis]